MKKKIFLILIFIVVFFNIPVIAENGTPVLKAKVIDVKEISSGEMNGQMVKVKVLEGSYKDQDIEIKYIPIEYTCLLQNKIGQSCRRNSPLLQQ